jgi:hypothetical protein
MRRRPSPATAISLVALVIAMSGTAYAATGGTFILGRANTATKISSLSNKNGTALSLSSKHGKPPLTVSNGVQVPQLNASKLGGITSQGFINGTGRASSNEASVTGEASVVVLTTAIGLLLGQCDQNGMHGAFLEISLPVGASATWWNFNGVSNGSTGNDQVTQQSTQDFMVVVQVTKGKTVSTFTAAQTYNTPADTCKFTAQAVTTTHS